MKSQIDINETVAVTALAFRRKDGLTGFPKRMEYDGRTYVFENGLQYLIKKSGEVVRIFDMVGDDGTYRLKCDEHQRGWTLLAMPPRN